MGRTRSTKAGLFLSYSSEDASLVRELAQFLRTSTTRPIFRDADSIAPGAKWADVIPSAVQAAELIYVFWCRHSANSRWVRKEYLLAAKLNKTIIPVLLDGTKLPKLLRQHQSLSLQSLAHAPAANAPSGVAPAEREPSPDMPAVNAPSGVAPAAPGASRDTPAGKAPSGVAPAERPSPDAPAAKAPSGAASAARGPSQAAFAWGVAKEVSRELLPLRLLTFLGAVILSVGILLLTQGASRGLGELLCALGSAAAMVWPLSELLARIDRHRRERDVHFYLGIRHGYSRTNERVARRLKLVSDCILEDAARRLTSRTEEHRD